MLLLEKNIEEMHNSYRIGELSVETVVKAYLKRIAETQSTLQAFSYINEEKALEAAKKLDQHGMPENAPLLWGIPVALKDNMCVQGFPVTCGSKILKSFVSPYNGTVAKRLLAQNAILIGNCHMDEFAMGSSNETNAFVSVKNPYDLERVPGGSSGGSAVTVSAKQVPVSLGSDTGGSIRMPASFCGVVGLKPTYGLVSRFGLVAYASSLDQIGPFAKTVKEAAILLQAIAGHDPSDSTSISQPVPDYLATLEKDIKGLKIGLPREYFTEGIDPGTLEAIENAKKTLQSMGAEFVPVSLPHTEYAIAAYYILATAEASANLARYDGIRYGHRSGEANNLKEVYRKSRTEGFGPEVKRRIILGTFVLSSGYYDAYYKKAQKVRAFVVQDFQNAFKNVDLILTPTSPNTAFKIGEKTEDPVSMYLSDIFTVSVNLAGLPAISIPCGTDQKNLPVGVQLIAPSLKEDLLLNVSHLFEKNHPPLKAALKV